MTTLDCACNVRIQQMIVRHKLLLTRSHILDFHLRPLISIKKRDARAQIFGGLELPGDFALA